jgi:glycosyltransferase involved in cell wall biosynthesis
MNKNPLVSVVMSVYNSELSLKKSIESIISQTYENIEFLIMDDASSDNSSNIINQFQKIDKRIKIFNNKQNVGLTKSLNLLIKETKGELIARQDADDISKKERIKKQVDYITHKNLHASTTRAKVIGENRVTPRFSYLLPKKILIRYKNPYIHGSLMIKKSVLKEHNFYDEKYYYSQDYKLMTDLIKSRSRIGIIKEPLYYLNMKNNISTNYYKEQQYYAKCVKLGIEP